MAGVLRQVLQLTDPSQPLDSQPRVSLLDPRNVVVVANLDILEASITQSSKLAFQSVAWAHPHRGSSNTNGQGGE